MPDSLNPAVARQWAKYQEAEAAARKFWGKKDSELRKLVKVAKLGRKASITVPITENRGVEITDNWRSAMRKGEGKIFTKAFNHRHEAKEVNLSA